MITLIEGVLRNQYGRTRASFLISRKKNGSVCLMHKKHWDSHLTQASHAMLNTHPSDWHESRKNPASLILKLALAPIGTHLNEPLHWNGGFYYDQFEIEWRNLRQWTDRDRRWLEQRAVLDQLGKGA